MFYIHEKNISDSSLIKTTVICQHHNSKKVKSWQASTFIYIVITGSLPGSKLVELFHVAAILK